MTESVEGALVPFQQRHVGTRVQWLRHPAVRVGIPIVGDITIESTANWARRVDRDDSRGDFVFEDSVGHPKVMCGVTSIDSEAARGELYMFVDPSAHGGGFGSEALRCLCEWSFETRILNRLFLYTMGTNSSARRFYERLGFVEEGCLRQHCMHQGGLEDRHVHGLLAADWFASEGRVRG